MKQPSCYKSTTNPTYIDLILTNRLQGTCVLLTGLSGFHLMTLAVMKKVFKKLKPRIINIGLISTFQMKHLENHYK